MPRWRRVVDRLLRLALAGCVLVAALAGGILAAALWGERHSEGPLFRNAARRIVREAISPNYIFAGRDRVTILLIGEDVALDNRRQRIKGNQRSDTNIVLTLDRFSGQAGMISLPRDTSATIPGYGSGHKLNAAHALGGPYLLIDTIESNFGLRIDHYVKTNFHGFIELVELVGGIEVDVQHDMDYDDNWADLHIHLQQGRQHLDGEQAHGYVRWRKNKDGTGDPKGDLGRAERQQQVIKLVVRKALSPAMLPRLPEFVRTLRKYVETDLSDRQLLSLAMWMAELDPDTLDTAILPTMPGRGTNLRVDTAAALPMLERLFGNAFDRDALLTGSSGDRGSSRLEALPDPQPSRLRELETEPEEWEVAEPAVVDNEAEATEDDLAGDPPEVDNEAESPLAEADPPSVAPVRPTPNAGGQPAVGVDRPVRATPPAATPPAGLPTTPPVTPPAARPTPPPATPPTQPPLAVPSEPDPQ